MILFVHREVHIIDNRFVVDRSDIHCSRVFNRGVVSSTGTDNFVLEGRVTIAKFIGLGLISELTQIGNSNVCTRRNSSTVKCQSTLGWETCDSHRSKRSCGMLVIELSRCKCMLLVFIDIDDKCSRDIRQFIGIRDVNVETVMLRIKVVSRRFGAIKIRNDQPEFFTASTCFDKAID